MSGPIRFETVWFSTDAQFAAFDEAFRNASWFQKAVGRYPIRAGAAYTAMILQPWTKIPIVLVAAGSLNIAYGRAAFASRAGWSMRRNVRTDLAFSLAASEMTSLEAHLRRSPVDPAFELTWTHVETTREPPLDNFYLCVGGRNALAMGRYRRQGLALREALQRLRDIAAPAMAPTSAFR
jgi:hypothetical protein